MDKLFLGLGSNMGDKAGFLNKARTEINIRIGEIILCSSLYETEPWGFVAESSFLNQVVKVKTALKPCTILDGIHEIESMLGRIRTSTQYESRPIDIDILFFGDLIIDEQYLQIPHPLISERKFVLVPLCEIAPEFIHPVRKISMKSLLESCDDKSQVIKAG